MSDADRRLELARKTWQSMRPSDAEVTWAARRIATRFQPRKSTTLARRVRMVSGALATVAGIAYAGVGQWSELDIARWRRTSDAAALEENSSASRQQAASPMDSPASRATAPRAIAVESLPVPVTEAPALKLKKKARAAAAAAVPNRARHSAVAPGAEGAPVLVTSSSSPATAILSEKEKIDATWADVSSALASHDATRAEMLLLQLADGGHDVNTRAKAHLGLAQLAASRNDCERTRVLALGVAATPGIEMKTVRRALELAVSCAR